MDGHPYIIIFKLKIKYLDLNYVILNVFFHADLILNGNEICNIIIYSGWKLKFLNPIAVENVYINTMRKLNNHTRFYQNNLLKFMLILIINDNSKINRAYHYISWKKNMRLYNYKNLYPKRFIYFVFVFNSIFQWKSFCSYTARITIVQMCKHVI